jgi:nitrogen fixation protein NifB
MPDNLQAGQREAQVSTPNLGRHPCFNRESAHTYARIHLPVAPKCNVQCRFCNRKFSCVNESRPGVTAELLKATEALERVRAKMIEIPNISVVGIAGPGDPFANPDETMETLYLVRRDFPELMLCVSSNGLNIMPYVDELKRLAVSHVTITVNAVDPLIAANIYDWVGETSLRGAEAARLLWDNQQLAIQALDFRGIIVKVNTVCVPGVNDAHVAEVAKTVSELGASLHNVIPLIPTADTPFAGIPAPSGELIAELRRRAKEYLPQMEHCSRCRADAVGLLSRANPETASVEYLADHVKECPARERCPRSLAEAPEERPYVAVASREGLFVNMHLGEASNFHIYSLAGKKPTLIDVRTAPDRTLGQNRWIALSKALRDCSLLIVSGAGAPPQAVLSASGIRVVITEGFIQEVLAGLGPDSAAKGAQP